MSVTSVGLAVHVSDIAKGLVSNKQIMMDNLRHHKILTKKTTSSLLLEDAGPLRETWPHYWAMVADKGYQGMAEVCQNVLPKKKPRNALLPLNNRYENQNIASSWIIVEIFLVS